jgi:hypothetical protein
MENHGPPEGDTYTDGNSVGSNAQPINVERGGEYFGPQFDSG